MEPFAFPYTQPWRRERSESPQSRPQIELLEVSFEDSVFANILDRLTQIQGDCVGASEPPPPEIKRPTELSTFSALIPSAARDDLTDLERTYPEQTNYLRTLQDGAYQEAYRICFRVRIFEWVTDDLPADTTITHQEILEWLMVNSPKTFSNMCSRFRGAKKSLEWLWNHGPLGESDSLAVEILSKLVEGPLTPLPARRRAHCIHAEDRDVATAQALDMSARRLDHLNQSLKERRSDSK